MKPLQHPVSFIEKMEIQGVKVSYHNLLEVCQGGPVIGELSLDGVVLKGCKFGGPLLDITNFIIIPEFKRNLFGSSFVISKINLSSGEVMAISEKMPLVYLSKIDRRKVYFYEDYEKMKESSIPLSCC